MILKKVDQKTDEIIPDPSYYKMGREDIKGKKYEISEK